jgi:hypothetical protein
MEDEVEIGRNKNRHQNNYKSSTAFVVELQVTALQRAVQADISPQSHHG